MNTDNNNNNKLKIDASNRMKEVIRKHIDNQPIYPTIAIINGERIQGKYLENIDLIVRININNFDAGLWNRDICRVIGETFDGKIVLRRLEDGHTGIVEKEQIKLPVWEKYDL